MSPAAAVAHPSPQTHTTPEIDRPITQTFSPSIWKDHFLNYSDESLEIGVEAKQQHEQMKEDVKNILLASAANPLESLKLIDTIQRLGVSYHFETEITEILGKLKKIESVDGFSIDDLHTISIWFRLLRQEGFNISSDIFKRFTNKEGKFHDSITSDVQGMLSLYEASHLMVHGEPILEEALTFSRTYLQSSLNESSPPFLTEQVRHALKQPIRKGLQRVEARFFNSIYHQDPSHNDVLLQFGRLDFNYVQKLHQKELKDISKWWKNLDFVSKLPFTRDRVVEGFFWIVGVYFEPKYALGRKILTKVIAITSIIDDTYDNYATVDELELFTDAIERWDISCIDQIPEYMRYCYKELLVIYDEIEAEMAKDGKEYQVPYAKEVMKRLARAYLIESKWFQTNYVPSFEEYVQLGLATCGYSMLTTTAYLGMGDIATKEAFDWASNYPKIIKSTSLICRYMDDIVESFEENKAHPISAVECYMRQNGVSHEEACAELRKCVDEAWKGVNEEFLEPRAVPIPLLTRTLNLARVMDVLYKDGDGYTHAGGVLKTYINDVFINHLPM
ncbi:hypothetical protein UlMin_003396 [Ulmus minor]